MNYRKRLAEAREHMKRLELDGLFLCPGLWGGEHAMFRAAAATLFCFCILFLLSGCNSMHYSAKEGYNRLQELRAQRYTSEEYGTIQYRDDGTTGVPVLVIHGIVGGFDQARVTGESLLPEHQRMISVSRFGCLESDLPDQPTPYHQCVAYRQLLDSLDISEVVLLATSAGGTIAFKFALMYPEYTSGMILVGSGYPENKELKGPLGPPSFIYSDFMFTFMLNYMHSTMLSMFGVTKKEYAESSVSEKRKLDDLFRVILPIKPRKPGILNDQDVTNPDMVLHYDDYKLESIEVPILILHARNDPMAKYKNMRANLNRLKNAEVYTYETGGHVLFGQDELTRDYIRSFLDRI